MINTSQQIGGAIGVAAATTIATTFTGHYVNAHPGATPLGGAAEVHGFGASSPSSRARSTASERPWTPSFA